jgi:hypothetical protein
MAKIETNQLDKLCDKLVKAVLEEVENVLETNLLNGEEIWHKLESELECNIRDAVMELMKVCS